MRAFFLLQYPASLWTACRPWHIVSLLRIVVSHKDAASFGFSPALHAWILWTLPGGSLACGCKLFDSHNPTRWRVQWISLLPCPPSLDNISWLHLLNGPRLLASRNSPQNCRPRGKNRSVWFCASRIRWWSCFGGSRTLIVFFQGVLVLWPLLGASHTFLVLFRNTYPFCVTNVLNL